MGQQLEGLGLGASINHQSHYHHLINNNNHSSSDDDHHQMTLSATSTLYQFQSLKMNLNNNNNENISTTATSNSDNFLGTTLPIQNKSSTSSTSFDSSSLSFSSLSSPTSPLYSLSPISCSVNASTSPSLNSPKCKRQTVQGEQVKRTNDPMLKTNVLVQNSTESSELQNSSLSVINDNRRKRQRLNHLTPEQKLQRR